MLGSELRGNVNAWIALSCRPPTLTSSPLQSDEPAQAAFPATLLKLFAGENEYT